MSIRMRNSWLHPTYSGHQIAYQTPPLNHKLDLDHDFMYHGIVILVGLSFNFLNSVFLVDIPLPKPNILYNYIYIYSIHSINGWPQIHVTLTNKECLQKLRYTYRQIKVKIFIIIDN